MNEVLRGVLPARFRDRRVLPALSLIFLAGLYGAGLVHSPPWGGILALLLFLILSAAVWLLLRRVGLFLGVFLTFAVVAPLLSRVVHLPMGWFKGTFFLLAFPLWFLTRAAPGRAAAWSRSIRLPLLFVLLSGGILAGLAAISFFRGVDPLLAADAVRAYLLYPPLLFLAAEAAGNLEQVRRFLRLVLLLCVLAASGAVAQALIGIELMTRVGLSLETWGLAYIAVDPLSGKFFQRVFSILDDQLALAAFSLVGMALSLYFLETERGRRRLLLVLALAVNAYALILTYNVTVMMGTCIFFLILVWKKRSPRLLIAFFAVVALLAGVAWLNFGPLIRNRLVASFSTEVGVSTSLVSRIEENRRALILFREDPIMGHGLGSTASGGLYYKAGAAEEIESGIATDNFYMTVALEGGLIGLIAVLLLHLIPLWGLILLGRSSHPEHRRLTRIGGAWVLVLLLMNLSNAPMNTNPTNLLYWLLAGLVWRQASAPDAALAGAPAGDRPE